MSSSSSLSSFGCLEFDSSSDFLSCFARTEFPFSQLWDRKKNSGIWDNLSAAVIMITAPIAVHLAIKATQSSIFTDESDLTFFSFFCLFFVWMIWFLLQFALHLILPAASCLGAPLNSGNRLDYRLNGFSCFCFTLFFLILFRSNLALMARRWSEFILITNCIGAVVTAAFWWRGKAKFSAAIKQISINPVLLLSLLDDQVPADSFSSLFLGIEKNPRSTIFNKQVDWKLFLNTRVGMAMWPIFICCLFVWQLETSGKVKNSLLLVGIFQVLYVVDLLINEAWYLRTMDIEQERLGFMLIWGDIAWVPGFYTLTAYYTALHGNSLLDQSNSLALFMMACGLLIFIGFRYVNNQREKCRLLSAEDAEKLGWTFLHAHYRVLTFESVQIDETTGKISLNWRFQERAGRLITNGSWGWARHFNYLVDLSYALLWSACGGFHLIPWLYSLYLCVLLLHRIQRDHEKCKAKYGENWTKYCEIVKFKLIPGIW
jgi:7-dehydrocholesterol reductase